ncbi:GNAT family N-acetyltransferase [Shimwellia blattae]|uniref:Putative GCN5-related N-acetyltransferase n=1 Tax=Shimwellia blattae (strain ATCC 29907 / DSM 4481 / JCM 1650 / NBRC 105725 / CDC 9005-74) TaxID=630626 RepID=I2B799_SHIBC|nr:GNAT family protein [Shimwellia blattae]AFJ46403.1 putative GCN5-related N-acetyltransferase [Shimwellia blattae DSM 4481 = NBRC 105725]GAB79984.1 putative GCN5-related N-acetyltransferase [Shimwellia blattae DSM 4481 = NBRC 105725]VDY63868.1 Putative ribosomal N-acetyltransferase YdaF [Shimwellia blattae]VEC22007.1 Putative ribosomal N-acetyltransferase YdaF [Shimwellia blattae]
MPQLNQWGQPVGDPLPDWQPRPRPGAVTLEGRYCRVVPFSTGHASALYRAYQQAADPRSWTWLFQQPPASEAEYQTLAGQMATSHDPVFYTIIARDTGQPVGTFSLMRIDQQNGIVEVGHVHFSPALQRTRMATEAHWLLMRYVFDTLGYRRYEWKCDSLNQPSRHAATRLGFHAEGLFRQALVYKGRTRDTSWFSIIDKEWPGRNQAFMAWLSPDNFDGEGRQRQSLQHIAQALARP